MERAVEPGNPAAASAVLTKAVRRTAERLALSQQQLSAVLGISRPSVSRLLSGAYALQRQRGKEWELGALLVRLYRSLAAIVGDDAAAQAWLRGPNTDLGASPISLIASAEGLVRVLQYVDAHRGA